MRVTRKEINGLHELLGIMNQLSSKGVRWKPGARDTLADLWIRLDVASWWGFKRSIDYGFANEDMDNLWNLFVDLGEYVAGNHNDLVINVPGLTRYDMAKLLEVVGGLLSDMVMCNLFAKYKSSAQPRHRKVKSLEYLPATLHVRMLISREPDDSRNCQVIFYFSSGSLPYFKVYSNDYGQSLESQEYEIGDEENSLGFVELCNILESERVDKFFA